MKKLILFVLIAFSSISVKAEGSGARVERATCPSLRATSSQHLWVATKPNDSIIQFADLGGKLPPRTARLTVPPISSESPRLNQLTLAQAIELAERAHPELAEAKSWVESAAGETVQAGAFPNPEAIARVESAGVRGRTSGEADYLAGISQSVPMSRRLSKARQAGQLEQDRRAHELEVKRRDIRKRVHSAFATALYQNAAAQTRLKMMRNTEELVAAVKARADAGDALPEDVARAEMEFARAKVEQQRAERLSQQSLIALSGAMGEPSLIIESLEGDIETAFEVPTLESLAAELPGYPAISAADADVRAGQARLQLARAERIPDINVELLYRRVQSEERDAIDLGIRVPLPLFNRGRGNIQTAQADLDAAEARVRSARNDASQRLRESHASLVTALNHSRALKTEILPRADKVVTAAELRFNSGDVSLAELLPVQNERAALNLAYLESLRDVALAWAELRMFLK